MTEPDCQGVDDVIDYAVNYPVERIINLYLDKILAYPDYVDITAMICR